MQMKKKLSHLTNASNHIKQTLKFTSAAKLFFAIK